MSGSESKFVSLFIVTENTAENPGQTNDLTNQECFGHTGDGQPIYFPKNNVDLAETSSPTFNEATVEEESVEAPELVLVTTPEDEINFWAASEGFRARVSIFGRLSIHDTMARGPKF